MTISFLHPSLLLIGGGLLQLFNQGLRAARLADDRAHAVLLARSKLTELQVYATLMPGVYEGEFDERYRWRVTLAERQTDTDPSLLREVPLDATLEVSWGELGDNSRQIALNTVLLSETAEQ